MTRDEWLAAFAREAGIERPSLQEIRDLLDLAAVAAHASERTAAPLACWMAGRAKVAPGELIVAAERVAAAASGETSRPPTTAAPSAGRGRR
jgi:hypothetical protein